MTLAEFGQQQEKSSSSPPRANLIFRSSPLAKLRCELGVGLVRPFGLVCVGCSFWWQASQFWLWASFRVESVKPIIRRPPQRGVQL